MRFSRRLQLLWSMALLAGCSAQDPVSTPGRPQSERTETGQRGAQVDGPDSASGTAGGEAPADETPGLAIGAKAPLFELKDQHGRVRALADLLADGAVALVFYRSADW